MCHYWFAQGQDHVKKDEDSSSDPIGASQRVRKKMGPHSYNSSEQMTNPLSK